VKRLAFLVAIATPLFAQSIAPAAIRAHVRFLSDDLVEGREAGTRGYDLAAEYVAAQFESIGLRRAGDSWFQRVAFRTSRSSDQAMSIDGVALTPRTDFLLAGSFIEPATELTAPVALAGFGIVAPELHHDDYKMVDVRGRIVLLIGGAPSNFNSEQRAYYSSASIKTRSAAARGAIGVLIVNSNAEELRVPFARRVGQESRVAMRALTPAGEPIDLQRALRISGRISQDTATKLMQGSNVDASTVLREADQGTTYGLQLKTSVTIRMISTLGDAKSANVVGVVRGTDPKLRSEYIVVSAHLDHLGLWKPPAGAPPNPDTVYNGTQDNASGIGVLIELARALAKAPGKRSVVFAAFTGEEKGTQGSRYFASFPPMAKESIVANVNMDMFLMTFASRDLIGLGAEHSTIGAMARSAAAAEGFELSPDPLPQEVRFVRSDQFSFVDRGIPAIHLKAGTKAVDPKIDGAKVTADFLKQTYHSRADDMTQPLDFDFAARYARVNLRLIRAIANAARRPAWLPGDFFGSIPRQ
jgi:Zn-dependent M28 family amino/carboxypeptidase